MSDIKNFLKLLSSKVTDNVEIVTPKTLGQDFFLHISKDTTKKAYIPFISTRAARSEDRTVPRVTVSDYLLGCIFGYATLIDETFSSEKDDKRGMYINMIPFEQALKPNSKLVYDQIASNEHWLVPYDEEHKEYPFERIGKMFVVDILFTPDNSKYAATLTFDVFIEITKEEGIKFSKDIFLPKGYYYVKNICNNYITYKGSKKITCVSITKNEFLEQKKISAALLSHSEKLFIDKW